MSGIAVQSAHRLLCATVCRPVTHFLPAGLAGFLPVWFPCSGVLCPSVLVEKSEFKFEKNIEI